MAHPKSIKTSFFSTSPSKEHGILAGFLNKLRKVRLHRKAAYFSKENKFAKGFKQSLLALLFNIFGVVAGTAVALNLGLFSLQPWVIAAYPAVISARGVIGGLLSGRLSTGLHIGTFLPRLFGNTRSFYLLMQAIVVFTLETSLVMSMFATLFGSYLWGLTISDFFVILGTITATMTLALFIVSPLTLAVAGLSFRHGLDPDIVLYPIESTVSDLLITLAYFAVLNLVFVIGQSGQYVIVFLCLLLSATVCYILLKSLKEKEFKKTIKESFLTLFFVAFIVNLTGAFLGKIADTVGSRREVYMVYPAMIDTIGDVGSVVGSTATTKFALGTLKPSFLALKSHMVEVLSVWTASLVMFVAYSILSLLTQAKLTLSSFSRFTATLVLTNILAATVIIAISFVSALYTFRKGLDPDNFVIPIESSLADSMTTVSLLIALTIMGFG